MEFTPIPELDGYFMTDSVAVWHEIKGEKRYLRPYHRKSGREFYVKVWQDGWRKTVAVSTLAKRTFGPPEPAMPEEAKRLPDFPDYRFHMHRGIMRVFKEGRELFASRHPRSNTPRFTLVDYNGKRSTVSDKRLQELFVNTF